MTTSAPMFACRIRSRPSRSGRARSNGGQRLDHHGRSPGLHDARLSSHRGRSFGPMTPPRARFGGIDVVAQGHGRLARVLPGSWDRHPRRQGVVRRQRPATRGPSPRRRRAASTSTPSRSPPATRRSGSTVRRGRGVDAQFSGRRERGRRRTARAHGVASATSRTSSPGTHSGARGSRSSSTPTATTCRSWAR